MPNKQLTILALEQHPTIQKIIHGMLSELDHTCIITASPEDALRHYCSNDDIDIVLLDVSEQPFNCTRLVESIQQDQANFPIILTVPHATDYQTLGVVTLKKPFTSEELCLAIAKAMSY